MIEITNEELNRLSAERVMGWNQSDIWENGWVLKDGTHIRYGDWNPTKNCDDLKLVMGVLSDMGFNEINVFQGKELFIVTFYHYSNGHFSIEDDTIEFAIIKGALKVKGIDF